MSPRIFRTLSIVLVTTSVLLARPVSSRAQSFLLYVANEGNGTVEQFNSSGTGTLFTSFTSGYPSGLAFDLAGDLYVTNRFSNTIMKYTSTGGVLSSSGTVFASGLDGPSDLAFDNAGDLYVSNQFGGSIEKYTATGGCALQQRRGLLHLWIDPALWPGLRQRRRPLRQQL